MLHQKLYSNILSLCSVALLTSVCAVQHVSAQTAKKELDKQAIRAMEGCYDVEFKYTETFAPEVDYEKAYDYTSGALELAEIIEETDDKIVLQHLLIIHDSMIIKHWRQDWIYEADTEFAYNGDNDWKFNHARNQRLGTWTQNVYQVDDSPRYSGTATWTHVDGISSWYNKADSPLPRRESSKRSDYNIMKRGNRVLITDYGWLHEQDNDKVIRTDSADILLAQEKGYNTYRKRPLEDCKYASNWWKKHKEGWTTVHEEWETIYANTDHLKLHKKVDNKLLYEHLFAPEANFSEAEVHKVITSYIDNQNNATQP